MNAVNLATSQGGGQGMDVYKKLGIMEFARSKILGSICHFLSGEQIQGAKRCAARIGELTLAHSREAPKTVLIGYGGGKDSSYTLAFMRAVQLIVHRDSGRTFRLRVSTNRHAGMPHAVMRNIDRCYRALGILDDPDCEAFLIDGNELRPFECDLPMPVTLLEKNRDDILMTGHRTGSDPRPTFCNACNISMVNSFGLAASHGSGADIIVTGDSRREQRAYLLWVNRLSEQFNLPRSSSRGFSGFLQTLDGISAKYATDIHGAHDGAVRQRRVATGVSAHLEFFSIYDYTDYASGDHWRLLIEFLQFQFDELAFSFTESDCSNPLLMAHLRGLKAERVFGRGYEAGIEEYVEFAIELMKKKDFPSSLIDVVRDRYDGAEGIRRMRGLANQFAGEAFRLTEAQLVCMVHSPFVNRGVGLGRFLELEYPKSGHDSSAICDLLALPAGAYDTSPLADFLRAASGMSLAQLREIFAIEDRQERSRDGLIQAILKRDPHKKAIQTRHLPSGPWVEEIISGR